jgi:hypothetical protein
MAAPFNVCVLPDGARIAYEILGSAHLGSALPLIMLCGMSQLRHDWDRVYVKFIRTRPGGFLYLSVTQANPYALDKHRPSPISAAF